MMTKNMVRGLKCTKLYSPLPYLIYMIETFKVILKIIRNKKLAEYKFKYILGFLGVIIGTYYYTKNKRWLTDKFTVYVSYFIVKSITGEDPLS